MSTEINKPVVSKKKINFEELLKKANINVDKKTLKQAMKECIYYQEEDILNQILPKEDKVISICDKCGSCNEEEFTDDEEVDQMFFSGQVLDEYTNDRDFLLAVNNEATRRYLNSKEKMNEYIKAYKIRNANLFS
jgi:hypothetical protein